MEISHCYWHNTGQEWQFHIATDIEWSTMAFSHDATDIFWWRMAISHCYWHLVVKNGNWQIYPKICQQISPQMHHGIYIMGCIWQPFYILQEKVGIFLYFWIIMVVNSHLAWYSHVRYNPLDIPQKHPNFTLITPHMIMVTMAISH